MRCMVSAIPTAALSSIQLLWGRRYCSVLPRLERSRCTLAMVIGVIFSIKSEYREKCRDIWELLRHFHYADFSYNGLVSQWAIDKRRRWWRKNFLLVDKCLEPDALNLCNKKEWTKLPVCKCCRFGAVATRNVFFGWSWWVGHFHEQHNFTNFIQLR